MYRIVFLRWSLINEEVLIKMKQNHVSNTRLEDSRKVNQYTFRKYIKRKDNRNRVFEGT